MCETLHCLAEPKDASVEVPFLTPVTMFHPPKLVIVTVVDACVSLAYVILYSNFLFFINPSSNSGAGYFPDNDPPRTIWFVFGVIFTIIVIALGISRTFLSGCTADCMSHSNSNNINQKESAEMFCALKSMKACVVAEFICVLFMQVGMVVVCVHGGFRDRVVTTIVIPSILAGMKVVSYVYALFEIPHRDLTEQKSVTKKMPV
jgi:hypothetical protein